MSRVEDWLSAMTAYHGTDDETAKAVAERIQNGQHGLLLSRRGDVGPGVYLTHNRNEAKEYGDAVIAGHAQISKQLRPYADPAVERVLQKRWSEESAPKLVEHVRSRGYDSVVNSSPGLSDAFTVLHPSQFRATHITLSTGERIHLPGTQGEDDGEIFAPKTHGK